MARPKRTEDKPKAPTAIAPQPSTGTAVMAPPPMMPGQGSIAPIQPQPVGMPPPMQGMLVQPMHHQPVHQHLQQPLQQAILPHQQQHVPQPSAAASQGPPMPPQQPARTVTIDYDSFMRVHNSNIHAIQLVMSMLDTLRNNMARHGMLLIGEGSGVPTSQFDPTLQLNNAAASFAALQHPEIVGPVDDKKERKKRHADPNAPKRPLTPYFLYMQHARNIIASDLGPEAPKGAVQEEGQRRWSAMHPDEKAGWNNAYKFNLRLYNARVHSYKNGNPGARDMTDEQARDYADQFNIGNDGSHQAAVIGDHDAVIAHQLQADVGFEPHVEAPVQDVVEEDEEEIDAEDEPASRTPKKATAAAARKRKNTAASAEPESSKAPTPAKKARRTSGKAPEEAPEPKKSGRKKAAK